MIPARRLLAPGAALVVVFVLATTVGPTSDASIKDWGLYRDYAVALDAGAAPYSEFALEYPPLSLVPFRIAALAGTSDHAYAIGFGALMLGCLLVLMVLCAALARDRGLTAAWLVALSPVLTGALVRTHFDLVAVVLAVAAVLALTRDRPATAFVLIGLGTMTKLFPLILVPVAVAWLVGRERGRAALGGVAVVAAVVALVSLPFLGSAYIDAYRFHLDRPLQVESTPAVLLLALGAGQVTGVDTAIPDRFRSNGVIGGGADVLPAVFVILTAAAIAALMWFAGTRPDEATLLAAAAGSVLAFIALGKVLSPQFAIWLIPIVAVGWARGARVLAGLCAAAILLTQIEFPSRYFDLVARDPGAIALVAVRDALLLAALSVCLWRASGSARSAPPAPAQTP